MALVLELVIAASLFAWSRWLARRDGVPRAVRYLGLLALLAAVAGPLATAWGLMRAFGAVEGAVEPSRKAVVLAEGIASAMGATVASLALLFLVALALLALTWKHHWRARPTNAPGAPPHR